MRKAVLLAATLSLAACSGADEAAAPAAAASRAAEASSAAPVAAMGPEADIQHFLLQEFPDAGEISYAIAWRDLNDDGANEAVVHLVGPWFCGTGGCSTLVLTQASSAWRKAGDISVSRTPITVLDSKTNGWSDLTVAIAGGGGPSGNALLKFDGENYPGNPTVPPAEMTETAGTVLLAEEPEMHKATPPAAPAEG